MRLQFRDKQLEELWLTGKNEHRLPQAAVTPFYEVMLYIESIRDVRELHDIPSLHFKKLIGDRKGSYSLRLNKQWRLIVHLLVVNNETCVEILSIEDYH